MLILFDNSKAAKEFRDNVSRWKEHLKWVEWGDKHEVYDDRVAWIRIVGLPLHLWGQSNFEVITQEFGKTIAPFEDIPNRVDLSHVKMGILTNRKSRINEEIHVAFENKVYTLGIIEFDEDWFPFNFDPSEDVYEKSNAIEEEMEEGEFRIETQRIDGDMGNDTENPPENDMVPTTAVGMSNLEDEQSHGEGTRMIEPTMMEDVATPRNMDTLTLDGSNHNAGHVITNPGAPTTTDPTLKNREPSNGPPRVGCFGFFSPILEPSNSSHHFRTDESNGKRRRVLSRENGSKIPSIPPMPSLPNQDLPPLPASPPAERSNSLIDLNTPPANQAMVMEVEDAEATQVSERIKTAKIGNELGFDIDPDDPILREVMGEDGENLVPQ